MQKIELHIFTNTIPSAPDTKIIKQTYQSFINTFGTLPTTVWCDKNPRKEVFIAYVDNLKRMFPVIHETTSLSDGYTKAIKTSKSKFLFMLEHDWIFNTTHIKHTLDEILTCMEQNNIYHFRFNKRKNIAIKRDSKIQEVTKTPIPFCTTSGICNIPHIILKQKYTDELIEHINILKESKGIENELSKISNTWGAIYGPLNYPATLTHINGKQET